MSNISMKSNGMTLEKDYLDLANMSQKEITQWLNTLVEGLLQKKAGSTDKSFRRERE